MNISRFKAPNTFVLMFSLIVLIAALTWVLPAGEYNRIEVNGREVVDSESYHEAPPDPQGIAAVLTAPIRGFVDAAMIIGFVLIVGGAFSVFQKTEAVDAAITAVVKAHARSKLIRTLLIPIFMILFSLAGAVFGMSEEVIPFILVFVPLALMLGYDSVTGAAIPAIGAGAGFAGAFLNPFTVGIAQGIAEIPLFSGIGYRLIVWSLTTTVAIIYVMRYAAKVKKDQTISPTYEIDKKKRKKLHLDENKEIEMDTKHKLVLGVFLAGLLVLVFGVLRYGWFIEEICAVFVITGIAVGLIGRLKSREIAEAFVSGAKDLVGTALVIALARGILVVATDGKIIDTILYHLSTVIGEFHPIVSSQAMFVMQSILNFFVPSGSGQAALTMPIMAPLGDLVGVTRQTAVLAFQFGDGFSNLIIPTSAVLMGILTLAEIPWERWARWILPLMGLFFLLGFLLLIPPYLMNWM